MLCLLIALMFYSIDDENSDFPRTLTISLSIGLLTHTLVVSAITLWSDRSPMWLIYLCTVPVGVIGGLSIGALLIGVSLEVMFMDLLSPIASLIVALMATYMFASYYSLMAMREALREEEVRRLENEKKIVETQLRLLQSQIEPHFLFNTLSNVLSLMNSDAERAEEMLRRLTKFLRVSLQRSRNESGSLADELNLLSDYLSILQIRMGDRLAYEFDVQIDAADIQLPPLILQPLVENAVTHGIDPLENGGKVSVRALRQDAGVLLEVEDNGAGIGTSSARQGFGLDNVR
ncbi:MAG: histidine kinase, partial [Pseudomonadales bacterium]|nr:histidine kinase [Pseudomonadales bacterium]